MPLVLVRHLPVALEKGICYGRSDVLLSAASQAQVPAFTRQLIKQHGPFGSVFTSPRQRCRWLADAISAQSAVEPALAEMDFGSWEGRRWAEIPTEDLDDWASQLLQYRPGGGESLRAMADRVQPWVERAAADAARTGQTVLAVTHGGPIRVAIALAKSMPLEKSMDIPVGFGWAVRFG
ncbi:MAG: alpha-ribazole phosphatase family protein [Pseudomonadota bacterium]